MKASGCDLSEIGARMKIAREAISVGQGEFAEQYGLNVRTFRKNEGGLNEAGICLASAFIRAGINANWLLTGEGPMLLADLKPQPAPGAIDPERLRLAIETVEEGLAATHTTMALAKKADLALAVYELLEEPGVNKERVLKLVKFAA